MLKKTWPCKFAKATKKVGEIVGLHQFCQGCKKTNKFQKNYLISWMLWSHKHKDGVHLSKQNMGVSGFTIW